MHKSDARNGLLSWRGAALPAAVIGVACLAGCSDDAPDPNGGAGGGGATSTSTSTGGTGGGSTNGSGGAGGGAGGGASVGMLDGMPIGAIEAAYFEVTQGYVQVTLSDYPYLCSELEEGVQERPTRDDQQGRVYFLGLLACDGDQASGNALNVVSGTPDSLVEGDALVEMQAFDPANDSLLAESQGTGGTISLSADAMGLHVTVSSTSADGPLSFTTVAEACNLNDGLLTVATGCP